ncbi:4'-phosphopantetheinyl transferase family protein [Demequina pelophila]|uniref:4'-phosphopantetheinyl transferase family protein n=1 Tax=Demequina pelophila TaxID=1638984 RepID=UPI000784BAAC|nr:4'-phosphopantetheinyl transferase superfamily protein [Demequina pelophila]
MITVHLVSHWTAPGHDARVAADDAARAAVEAACALPASTPIAIGRRCHSCGSRDHGAPFAAFEGESAVPHLSISRAPGVVIAAACVRAPVGVDVEAAGTPLDPRLADVALAAAERPRTTAPGDLLRAWVRKEALLKATGAGLAVDPATVELHGTRVARGPAGPWELQDVDLSPGLVVSVAVRAEGPISVVSHTTP